MLGKLRVSYLRAKAYVSPERSVYALAVLAF